jgi:hypothetical protein
MAPCFRSAPQLQHARTDNTGALRQEEDQVLDMSQENLVGATGIEPVTR